MGLRAKGWGSTMVRATVRHMRRAWDGDGILVCGFGVEIDDRVGFDFAQEPSCLVI
jgi:hypothetical protein